MNRDARRTTKPNLKPVLPYLGGIADTHLYTLRDEKNIVVYVGITNNPERRMREHRTSGKIGRMCLEGGPYPREYALALERREQRILDERTPKARPPLRKRPQRARQLKARDW